MRRLHHKYSRCIDKMLALVMTKSVGLLLGMVLYKSVEHKLPPYVIK
jgi:hypothetical protein